MTETVTISEFFETELSIIQLECLEMTNKEKLNGVENDTQKNTGIKILFSASDLAKRYIQRITVEIAHNKTINQPREDITSFSYLYRNAELRRVKSPSTATQETPSILNGLILPDASYEVTRGEVVLWLSGIEQKEGLSVIELFPESAVLRVANRAGQSWGNSI